jgi:hypothetical protein
MSTCSAKVRPATCGCSDPVAESIPFDRPRGSPG